MILDEWAYLCSADTFLFIEWKFRGEIAKPEKFNIQSQLEKFVREMTII